MALGFGVSLAVIPALTVMQNGITDAENYDAEEVNDMLSGIVNAAFALGACVGPILASTLTGAIGFAWTSTAIFGVCGACVLLYFVVCMYELRQVQQELKQSNRRPLLSQVD